MKEQNYVTVIYGDGDTFRAVVNARLSARGLNFQRKTTEALVPSSLDRKCSVSPKEPLRAAFAASLPGS